MRKKFLSAFLLGAVTLAATSTVVSCKDYDDDISSLQSQIDKTASDLQAAKTALESQIATMKTELQAKDTELQQAINGNADNISANATKIKNLEGDVAALTTRIAAAESAISNIEAVLAKKVDQVVFDAKVKELVTEIAKKVDLTTYEAAIAGIQGQLDAITGRLSSVEDLAATNKADIAGLKIKDAELEKKITDEETARIAAVQNLQTQIDALNAYKARVEANETKLAELGENVGKMKDDIEALQASLSSTIAKVAANEIAIADLQKKMQSAEDAIEKLNGEVSVLTVLVKTSLRSLVFIPDTYYWGIEAAQINLEATYKFTVPAAAFNVKETKGYDNDERYDSVMFKTTYGFAKYHKNPSNAEIDKSRLSLVSFDRSYSRVSTNAAPAGLSIVNDSVVDKLGDLYVPLNVNDVSKVQKVSADATEASAVTVFALQYTLNKAGEQDTTITSDYAALLASEDTVSYKIALINNPMTSSVISSCVLQAENKHAMQTVKEAGSLGASYQLAYGDTIDLNNYVASHRIICADGTETALTLAEFAAMGYKYEFALTQYDVDGENQSAHATIVDGSKLTTNKCDYDAILNGYTPVVRVVLKDKNGNILDYGYIKFEITGDLCDYIGTVKYEVSDDAKVKSYWYAINGAEQSGKFEEIHYNVKTPEEAGFSKAVATTWSTTDMANALALANNKIINVFTSENVFDATQVEVKDTDGDVDMIAKNYVQAGDFIFTLAKKNNGKEFKGDTGTVYTMSVTENGDSLLATTKIAGKDSVETVATLAKNVAMAQQKLVLNHESSFAKDLLNYKGRYELDNDVLTAYVALGLTVKKAVKTQAGIDYEECQTVETENVWPSRFIRPINLDYTNPTPIQDAKRGEEAAEYKGQPAYLHDILSFKDWQNIDVEYVSDTTNCLYAYYGIESVEIIDADGNALADGDDVIENADNVLTNIANPKSDEGKPMKEVIVGGAVTLTFKAATATTPAHIWYINNGNTVSEDWWFEIPVRVNYYWGSFVRRVKVTVHPTYVKG